MKPIQYRFVSDVAEEYYGGVFQPTRAADAGIDLRAMKSVTIWPGDTVKVGAGVAINIQDDDVAAITLPRSGTGTNGLVLGNLVGLIDCGYQGELTMTLWNRTDRPIEISAGDRVAQLVRIRLARAEMQLVKSFEPSERGEAGFGSSGIK